MLYVHGLIRFVQAEKKKAGVQKQLEEAASTGEAYRGNIKVQMNNQAKKVIICILLNE